MQRALSFEQGPSLSGPLRFFLTAPLFALAAALLLLWFGQDALASRWAMPTLALTHLLTLGFLAMTMCGALLQILPVVAGVPILRPELTANVVHLALGAGATLLVAGFLLGQPHCFQLAAPLLGLAFFWLIGSTGTGLLRAFDGAAIATVSAIRLALLSLAVTAGLGITLSSAFGWSLALPLLELTDLHASWGLLGWIGVLVAGVAFQVIPMFQATPVYPRRIALALPALMLLTLTAWSLARVAGNSGFGAMQAWLAIPVAACVAAFAALSLHLLHKRKRKPDPTTLFWRLSMACLLAGAALHLLPWDDASRPLLLGVLFIVGFAMSAVNGMLYKIVPFLLWYHLQDVPGLDRKAAPNIKTLLPDAAAARQFWLHLAALALLLAAVLAPHAFTRPAAALFAVSTLLLWWNLLHAARLYRQACRSVRSPLVVA
jgi:uncharacterized membrane protein